MEEVMNKSDVRSAYGVNAIRVRGELVHPECRTDEECGMTVQFLRVHNGYCDRCERPLVGELGRTLAARIRELRKERGWSMETLGHRSDIHPTIISKLERRRRGVTFAVLLKFAQGFGITLSEMLEGVEKQ